VRLATFRHRGAVSVGVVDGQTVHPIDGVAGMLELVRLGLPAALAVGTDARAGRGADLADVTLLAPIEPPTFRDFVAFEEHVQGVRQAIEGSAGVPPAWYDAPAFYFSNPYAVVGHGADVPMPQGSVAFDYELEVAAVVGRSATDLGPEEGREAIFGYTILNDWSARDLQRPEMQVGLGPAKAKDFASTLGPWIVTADELHPHEDADGFLELWCEAAVNGVVVGRDVLANMGWTFGAMVSHASRDARIEPGDVLGSGTTGNGGCLAELWGRRGRQDPPPLQAGDEVALTVEGIGTVRNRIVAGSPTPGVPPARRRDPAHARAAYLDGRAS
jgi:2-keto-4-pentenoate hydratase/2-oxohepta-3-ene-1,7-dioic acid hydratase in catechol pathway